MLAVMLDDVHLLARLQVMVLRPTRLVIMFMVMVVSWMVYVWLPRCEWWYHDATLVVMNLTVMLMS